jgi:hypothetical protein
MLDKPIWDQGNVLKQGNLMRPSKCIYKSKLPLKLLESLAGIGCAFATDALPIGESDFASGILSW